MDFFSTREIAAIIWLSVFLFWGLTLKKVRVGAWGVVKATFRSKLAVIWILGGVWMSLGVYFLSMIHLWGPSFLKDTVIWCFSAGVVVLVHGFAQAKEGPNYSAVVLDLFKLTIFLELLLSTYCFSLVTEIILFLLVAIVSIFHAYSQSKEEYEPVRKLSAGILFVLGIVSFSGAIIGFVKSPGDMLNVDTVKGIAWPILLTFWLIPVSYAVGLFAAYEIMFVPFHLGGNRSIKFHVLARFRLIRHFGFRLNRVLKAPRLLQGGLYGVYSLDEIDRLLSSLNHRQPAFEESARFG